MKEIKELSDKGKHYEIARQTQSSGKFKDFDRSGED